MTGEKAIEGFGLPVERCLPELRKVLASGHAVLCAPPGSGKTTRVPLALLDEPWLSGRRILMLEPRRPAARLAAAFMARGLGEAVGETVGYQVRFDRRIGPNTRIEVLTEGILTRRLQSDPELADVGLVIFDEFHERNLQADLGLALCLDVVGGLREDLRLLVMSATLETGPLESLLPADAVVADGRQYPVEPHFLARPILPAARPAAVTGLVRQALRERDGDILVFLPGRREMRRVAEGLADLPGATQVVMLHGDLPAAEQDRVLASSDTRRRRIVLSTDLAESSVTIPGIATVVDSGLARKPRFDASTGLTRLATVRIARDSAAQRAGRAGRLGPGRCYRAWTSAEHERLAATTEAEILQADLAGLVLELAHWGVQDPFALRWLDPPPPAHWAQALGLLQRLSALDDAGRITGMGRAMARVPAHPRLAHLLQVARDSATAREAADLAALLGERDPWRAGGGRRSLDIRLRLDALRTWRESGAAAPDFDGQSLRRIDRTARQLSALAGPGKQDTRRWSTGALLSLAYPDRLAQRRATGQGRFLLASGREVRVAEDDPLASKDFLVIPHLDAGQREAWAWLAAPCDREELECTHRERLCAATRMSWDSARGAVVARREVRLDALVLERQTVSIDDPEAAGRVLLEVLRKEGLERLNWDERARSVQARILTARNLEPEGGWPDVSDTWLLGHLEVWLGPWLSGATRSKELRTLNLEEALLHLLDWTQRRRLDELLPVDFSTPAGTRRRIRYRPHGPPELHVPLQEMFGVAATPVVAAGRQTLLLHLLSPAGRPLQITQDLGHFWRNAYREVRRDMRGRYPKHAWPEDPLAAEALRSGLRRKR